MGNSAKMAGFIIANRQWPAEVRLEMGMHTFAKTASAAWRRHIGPDDGKQPTDFPIIVQRWSDRGYGPCAVDVELTASSSLAG